MIKAAVLTILIETILFYLYGYRQKMFLLIVMLANLLTNVSLNLAVFLVVLLGSRQILPGFVLFVVIAAGEIGAVAVEYIVYETYIRKEGGARSPGNSGNSENSGAAAATGAMAGAIQNTHHKRRLFLQVLLSNAVSFGVGLLLTHFAG